MLRASMIVGRGLPSSPAGVTGPIARDTPKSSVGTLSAVALKKFRDVGGNLTSGVRRLWQGFAKPGVAATAGMGTLLLGAQQAFGAEPRPLISDQGLSQILLSIVGSAAVLAVIFAAATAFGEYVRPASVTVPPLSQKLHEDRFKSFGSYLSWIAIPENDVGMWSLGYLDWYINEYLVSRGQVSSPVQEVFLRKKIVELERGLKNVYRSTKNPSETLAADAEKYLNDIRSSNVTILKDSKSDAGQRGTAQLMIYAVDIFAAAYAKDKAAYEKDRGALKK